MPRLVHSAACIAMTFTPLFAGLVHAGDPGQYMGYHAFQQPLQSGPAPGYWNPAAYGYTGMAPAAYPQLDASLYPCPRPDIPYEVGSTVITNPALAPHEMLYPHEYRTVYPPYYYKEKIQFGWCPEQICEGKSPFWRKKQKFVGTKVTVKYNGWIAPWKMFVAPDTQACPRLPTH